MSSLTDDQLRVDSEVTIKCGSADHRMQRELRCTVSSGWPNRWQATIAGLRSPRQPMTGVDCRWYRNSCAVLRTYLRVRGGDMDGLRDVSNRR